tara:strand:- start:1994 stop:2521 length:528 start_codon:yes stop_codon:yes gene_type:complete
MGVEIERRFLVEKIPEIHIENTYDIIQYYLPKKDWLDLWPSDDDEIHDLLLESDATFRLRNKDGVAYATIKGASHGAIRQEFEREIDVEKMDAVVNKNKYPSIEKKRMIHVVNREIFWEIDCFEGENSGLIIAEIEIPSPNYSILLPDWIDREITGEDNVWSNYALAINPLINRN